MNVDPASAVVDYGQFDADELSGTAGGEAGPRVGDKHQAVIPILSCVFGEGKLPGVLIRFSRGRASFLLPYFMHF